MSDVPKSIESDDEQFEKLMRLQDPFGIEEFDGPETIEEKYETQIFMDCVVLPQFEELLENQEDKKDEDVAE